MSEPKKLSDFIALLDEVIQDPETGEADYECAINLRQRLVEFEINRQPALQGFYDDEEDDDYRGFERLPTWIGIAVIAGFLGKVAFGW